MLGTKTESPPYNKNRKFILDRHDELMEKYPEHWILVIDEKVVTADRDPWEFVAKLREIGPPPKGQSGYMAIELLTEMDWIHP